MKLATPYKDLLPPLSTEELSALRADIKANGVQVPIAIDEDGNILDGHNRYSIDKNAPTFVVKGLTDDEKQSYTIRMNLARRNLSFEQRREIAKKQRELANRLRATDAKKWTQAKLGATLGVTQQAVAKWSDATNTTSCNSSEAPDARIKITPKQREVIVDRVNKGETQEQVAADYKIARSTVGKIFAKASELHSRDDDKQRKTAKLGTLAFDVRKGDFREVLSDIESASLILTDPPYPKESIHLWSDLGKFASQALADDGILVAYSGQMYLPEVLSRLCEHLDYWWCGALIHKGTGNLTPLGHPVRKVKNGWKPLVMFVKRGGTGFERTFADRVDGQGKEKQLHNWQQNEAEAGELVSTFTKKGELVVDPMAGSGVFLRAAETLGRKAIGAEILA